MAKRNRHKKNSSKNKTRRSKTIRAKVKFKKKARQKTINSRAKRRTRHPANLGTGSSTRPGTSKRKAMYSLNQNFEFFSELKSLILKASPAEKDSLIKKISALGKIKLAVISGIFLNSDIESSASATADLFIVGDNIDRNKLRNFLKSLEAEIGREIRFGLMDREEFEYRFGMFDRFIRVLLEGPHEKIINRLGI